MYHPVRRGFVPLSVLALALASTSAFAADPPSTFRLDPVHSSVAFKIRHLVSKVSGQFTDFSGTIVGDPKAPAGATIAFTIKAASINTQNADRDKHLQSPDFFDAQKFPEISFTSSKITAKGSDKYEVTGTFTMHGVSKDIVVPVSFGGVAKDPWGNDRAGFSIAMTLNRKDFGVNFNKVLDAGGMMLGDDVEISIELEAVKKGPEKK
jgi:polyisoprenoid-binding protein YceI